MNSTVPATLPSFGLVGCGHRGIQTFILDLIQAGGANQLKVICDPNKIRLAVAHRHCPRSRSTTDYAGMLADPAIDTVIVSVPDYLHAKLAIQALEAGKHVVCEKPMAVRVEDCDAMIHAAKASGRRLQVGFNLRFAPLISRTRELLLQGAIGRLLAMDCQDYLSYHHGAEFFRRWHRDVEKSGGLMITKACHLFDLFNWLADADPVQVIATGARTFFLPREHMGERCSTCRYTAECEVYVDMTKEAAMGVPWDTFIKDVYLDAESEDGYVRDLCSFLPDTKLKDQYSVLIDYANGVRVNYQLLAFAPKHYKRMAFFGTEGRMEIEASTNSIRIMKLSDQKWTDVVVPEVAGRHGGADTGLLGSILRGDAPGLKSSLPGPWEGRMAVAVGCAANISMEESRAVHIPTQFGNIPTSGV